MRTQDFMKEVVNIQVTNLVQFISSSHFHDARNLHRNGLVILE